MSHKPLNEGEYWFNSAKIRLQMILTFVLLLVFVTILGIRQSIESEQEVEETTDELKIKILELQKLVENHYTERLLNTETQLKIISHFIIGRNRITFRQKCHHRQKRLVFCG